MGDIDKNKITVETLCELWEQKQQNFEMDIRMLLDKAKWLAMQLSAASESPPPDSVNVLRVQQQFKLNYLIIHLTEEMQRQGDKASAKARLQEWNTTMDKMRLRISIISEGLSKLGLVNALDMEKLCEVPDNSQRNFELLSHAVQLCESLRAQNLSVLIRQAHTEIDEWCDLTLQYPTVRNYKKDCYTKELLEMMEAQLIDIKRYYNTNKPIFELYAKRLKLWRRMEALDEKTKKPNRYHNRGGILLREERERKIINIKLPQIEQKLTELVQVFEQENGRPFLVQGEEILSRIATDWEDYRVVKEQESAARKKAASEAILDPLRSTHSSLISLRKTTSVPYFNSPTTSIGSTWTVKLLPEKRRERL